MFQHDNDPKHTAGKIKEYLQNADINVLEWPPYSPDLNPIEHLWKVLDEQTIERRPKNENGLYELLKNEWANIPKETIEKLVKSMPRRCATVIENDGFPTKY